MLFNLFLILTSLSCSDKNIRGSIKYSAVGDAIHNKRFRAKTTGSHTKPSIIDTKTNEGNKNDNTTNQHKKHRKFYHNPNSLRFANCPFEFTSNQGRNNYKIRNAIETYECVDNEPFSCCKNASSFASQKNYWGSNYNMEENNTADAQNPIAFTSGLSGNEKYNGGNRKRSDKLFNTNELDWPMLTKKNSKGKSKISEEQEERSAKVYFASLWSDLDILFLEASFDDLDLLRKHIECFNKISEEILQVADRPAGVNPLYERGRNKNN